jgi:hypothetical protein
MSQESHTTLDQCLRAVWQRTQRGHAIGALLAFARWFVPLFLVVILIDRLAYLPGWLRAVAALSLLALALRQAWRHGGSRLRRFDATLTAQQIEHAQGGLDSLLVTALQFQKQGASPGTSAAMWEHSQHKAQEAARHIAPREVVPMTALKRPLRIALGVAALLLIFAILQGPFLAAGLGRLFTPWLAIAYPTDTQIKLGSGEMVIQEGAPAGIEIRLSGEIPKTAELALRTGEGKPREIDLEVVDGLSTYQITSASRDFSYRANAGDARSDWRQVRVIPAPRMAKVAVELDFPDYIDRPNETVEALTLTVPEETKVSWKLTLDTPIREATLHRDDAADLPLEIGADGRTLTLSENASASRGYSFSWVEKSHGFAFTSPRYFLQVASDQAPRIELTAPLANLNALLGRPLALAVRMQDDHGIGAVRIIHRVNRRPEKTVEVPSPAPGSEGEQVLDWDYRKDLPDLQVGDSVSFLVEVADKYPGEGGAHLVRSETRRITFLSREDYLAEVNKQMDSLLTRVRTLYRQQRAAHELALGLDPASDSFVSTCQLEAIRQEMVREQLVTTADEVQALLDDLAANQVTDAVESGSLAAVRDAIRTIAADHVARAADLMRAQVGAEKRDPQPAIAAINEAARELAGLVLQRGIEASREVYARETRMLAGELARLRLRLLTASPDEAEALAKAHEDVAAWTDDLLNTLSAGMRYDNKALAVLGLNRSIYALRTSKLADEIRNAAKLAREGRFADAAAAQYPLTLPLIEAEFPMRAGSDYALIRGLREQLTLLIAEQQQLNKECSESEDFTKRAAEWSQKQAGLRNRLVLAAMPTVAAPRARLFDLDLPEPPPGHELRLKTEALMGEATTHLKAKAKAESLASQAGAITALKELDAILTGWSDELAKKTLGVSSQVSDASDRAGVLEQFEARQIALLEQTEEAALDEKDAKEVIEEQQALLDEIEIFAKELSDGESAPAGSLMPILGRLGVAGGAMKLALTTLRDNRAEEALEPQEQAAVALAEATALAKSQVARFTLLQQLISFEQAVAKASSGMADVVGGQNDLIAATKVADEKSLPSLLAPQKNLLQCLTDIAPALDLVAARLDVGTPLVFAASDVEDALIAMEDDDAEGAAEIQGIAVESLAKVNALVAEVSVQTAYIAEIVEYLQETQSTAAMLAFRQRQIREGTGDSLEAQETLASDAAKYAAALTEVAGQVDFGKLDEKVKEKFEGFDLSLDFNAPAASMAQVVSLMQSKQAATDEMLSAEKALDTSSQQLNVIIEMLNGLPSIILTSAEPPELHRLIKVLDIASKHRVLLRQARGAAAEALPSLSKAQQKLVEATAKANEGELTHPLLAKAHEQMATIDAMLTTSRKEEAGVAQLTADQTLRHFIIEQALILNTAIPPASSSDSDVLTESETDDLYYSESVGFLSDFVSGEAPKDKKSEWEILGTRNRAALNQNFARELPLEYRATLKDYYEKVAK